MRVCIIGASGVIIAGPGQLGESLSVQELDRTAVPERTFLVRVAEFTLRRRRAVLAVTGLLVVVAGWFGVGVVERLSNGGYAAATGNLRVAQSELRERFGVDRTHLILVLRAGTDVGSPRTAAAGAAYTERVAGTPAVASADSFWTTGDPLLRSDDRRSAVVMVRLDGDDDQAQRTAKRIVPELIGEQGPFQVGVTGEAQTNGELQRQSDQDLVRAELFAAPVILLILLLVFRTVVAALLPFLVGVIGVVLTLAILRAVSEFTDVSIFALNLTTALGLGLAIDYSLFILMRFREETEGGKPAHEAAVTAVRTAGRTVFFSALTVALCLSALLVFPSTSCARWRTRPSPPSSRSASRPCSCCRPRCSSSAGGWTPGTSRRSCADWAAPSGTAARSTPSPGGPASRPVSPAARSRLRCPSWCCCFCSDCPSPRPSSASPTSAYCPRTRSRTVRRGSSSATSTRTRSTLSR